jgi:hypothetical protein
VNPHQKAIVTLEWIQIWERGHFTVYKDGKSLGSVSYKLLKDLKLDSDTQSIDCGLGGQIQMKPSQFRSTNAPRDSGP